MIKKAIELTNKDITKELFSTVAFISIAEGGAMGEPGGVYFYDDAGHLYHFNTCYGDVDFENFVNTFPVFDQVEFLYDEDKVLAPEGWNYMALGAGNHLLITDRWIEEAKRILHAELPLSYRYQTWKMAAEKILNPDKNLRVSKEDRVKVFDDTRWWTESDDDLQASIAKAKKNTQVFYEDDYPAFDRDSVCDEVVTVTQNRSYQAAMALRQENPDAKIAVLNFANAFHAGGGVTKGASAQEECLCRSSTLYPLLYRRTLRDTFYKYHRDRNSSKASDSLIYTEGVVICKTDEDYPIRMRKEDWVTVDVITLAAPDLRTKSNIYAALVGNGTFMNDTELFGCHVKRAIHMLTVAASKGADILVLGAFGCGAFENNPEVVAQAYKVALQVFPKVFKRIEFAVYCSPKDYSNYEAFKRVLAE